MLALLPSPPAFSLQDEWFATWRRIEDRHGRPDAEGTLLQWASDPQYLEYPFDQRQASFPLGGELAWQGTARGARLSVQSITEFSLTNVVELKDAWALGQGVSIGVRYHQLEDRHTASHLARLVIEGVQVAETPVVFEFHLFPRWEKEDLDLEAAVGLTDAELGTARLRLFALDPFVNASYALAESRGAELPAVYSQQDAPLALAFELASARWRGLRGELYGGVLLSATTERRVPGDEAATTTHTQAARVAGALVEWAGPLTVGATVLHVAAEDRRTAGPPPPGARPSEGAADEARTAGRLYAVAQVAGAEVEAQLLVSTQDFRSELTTGEPDRHLGESRRLAWLRGWWPSAGVVAAEVGFLRVDRAPTGEPPAFVDADAAHRLTTRVAIRLPPLWFALGVGWDLEPGDGRYDGGGLTLILAE